MGKAESGAQAAGYPDNLVCNVYIVGEGVEVGAESASVEQENW